MPPWAEIKYSYGHILEALVIALAKAAGHRVEGEQDEVSVDGILGHRDCVIDGCLVDVKSASSRSFEKFKSGSLRQDDPFGYLDQLDGYLIGSRMDDLVVVKDKGYLLAVDKTLGHMVLYEHRFTAEREDTLRARIKEYKNIVSTGVAPQCTCGTVADGKSGNIKLDTKASYSPYKYCCHPFLRTFAYAGGPVFLTKVVRVPDVPELPRPRAVLQTDGRGEEESTLATGARLGTQWVRRDKTHLQSQQLPDVWQLDGNSSGPSVGRGSPLV